MSIPNLKSTGKLGPKTKSACKKENAVKKEKAVNSKVSAPHITARISPINSAQFSEEHRRNIILTMFRDQKDRPAMHKRKICLC